MLVLETVFVFQADKLLKALREHFGQQESTENVSIIVSQVAVEKCVVCLFEEEVTGSPYWIYSACHRG